ncbi:cysteine proteinase inhibitor 1-like [Rosa rugosa]|uniref:cysteine proteinase inhibitor 1-like n=1 Tax=Rosa rugosa TaxID=74645 RepID=UPI002B4045FF|nr:cysteine proteinase inhibitor 1-like [Rosa rugosa]
MRYQCFLTLIALFLPLAAAMFPWYGGRVPLPSPPNNNFAPVNGVFDEFAKVIGGFAVSDYNKLTAKKLVFQCVISSELVAGDSTYKLVTAAKNGSLLTSLTVNYKATVWFNPHEWGFLKLKTFGNVKIN